MSIVKTVVVGILNAGTMVDNLLIVPPRYEFPLQSPKDILLSADEAKYVEVIVHHSPVIELCVNPIKNFDILIDCNDAMNPDYQVVLDDKYVSLTRNSKTNQMLTAFKICKKLNIDWIIPAVYSKKHIEKPIKILMNHFYDFDSKVVVKWEFGAGGKSQAVIDSYLLQDFFHHLNDSLPDLQKRFPSVIFSEQHDPIKTSYFPSTDLLIQQFIPDITNEYRVMVFGDEIVVYERQRHGEAYKQANLSHDVIKDEIEVGKLPSCFGANHISEIKAFVKELDLKIGSIDLFAVKTNDGKMQLGIFEYCNQFAFYSINPRLMRDLHTNAITKIIRDRIEFN